MVQVVVFSQVVCARYKRLYAGRAEDVPIITGERAFVLIVLQQLKPPKPFGNAVPRFTALLASSEQVDPKGTVQLKATAVDPDPDDTLVYSWQAASGSLAPRSPM